MKLNYINYFKCIDHHFQNKYSSNSLMVVKHPCIGYLKEGEAEFLYEGKKYKASAGDLIYIAKNTRYYSVWTGSPRIHFYSLNYRFLNSDDSDGFPFQIIYGMDSKELDVIMDLYKTDPMKSLGHFYLFIVKLYEMLVKGDSLGNKETILPALTYISKHYSEKVSIKFLSELCNLSESYFYSKFKEIMNCSPIKYKNAITIQRALDLLLETNQSVEEISFNLGFSTPSYFIRLFKRMTGKTPGEIRTNREIIVFRE